MMNRESLKKGNEDKVESDAAADIFSNELMFVSVDSDINDQLMALGYSPNEIWEATQEVVDIHDIIAITEKIDDMRLADSSDDSSDDSSSESPVPSDAMISASRSDWKSNQKQRIRGNTFSGTPPERQHQNDDISRMRSHSEPNSRSNRKITKSLILRLPFSPNKALHGNITEAQLVNIGYDDPSEESKREIVDKHSDFADPQRRRNGEDKVHAFSKRPPLLQILVTSASGNVFNMMRSGRAKKVDADNVESDGAEDIFSNESQSVSVDSDIKDQLMALQYTENEIWEASQEVVDIHDIIAITEKIDDMRMGGGDVPW